MTAALPGPRPPERPAQPMEPSVKAVMPGESPRDRVLPVAVVLLVGAVLLVQFWPEVEQAAADARRLVEDFADRRTDVPELPASQPRSTAPRRETAPAASTAPTSGAPAPAAALGRLVEALPSLASGPLRKIDAMSSEGMHVDVAPDGQVLMTSKYAVQRFGAGDVNDRRTVFSTTLYREQFPDERPQAMASALALPGERYLIGGWHGEVLLWEQGRLRRLSARDERPTGRIVDMQRRADEVLVAGDGLWRLTADGLRELPTPGLGRIRALGQRSGQLLLAGGRDVRAWRDGRLQAWLSLPDDGGQVERIVPTQVGSDWWIGTTRGLYRVSEAGVVRETLLPGVWVTSVSERGDALWVGSWRQGLLLRREGQWYRLGAGVGGLADDSVSDLAIDAGDRLWLTLYGGGGWQSGLAPLRETLLRRPWEPQPDPSD